METIINIHYTKPIYPIFYEKKSIDIEFKIMQSNILIKNELVSIANRYQILIDHKKMTSEIHQEYLKITISLILLQLTNPLICIVGPQSFKTIAMEINSI